VDVLRDLLAPRDLEPPGPGLSDVLVPGMHEIDHDQVRELIPEERDFDATRATEIPFGAHLPRRRPLGLEIRVAEKRIEELSHGGSAERSAPRGAQFPEAVPREPRHVGARTPRSAEVGVVVVAQTRGDVPAASERELVLESRAP